MRLGYEVNCHAPSGGGPSCLSSTRAQLSYGLGLRWATGRTATIAYQAPVGRPVTLDTDAIGSPTAGGGSPGSRSYRSFTGYAKPGQNADPPVHPQNVPEAAPGA